MSKKQYTPTAERGRAPDRYLTVKEVAEFLACSTGTVYDLCAAGALKSVRLVGQTIRIHGSAVDAYLGLTEGKQGGER